VLLLDGSGSDRCSGSLWKSYSGSVLGSSPLLLSRCRERFSWNSSRHSSQIQAVVGPSLPNRCDLFFPQKEQTAVPIFPGGLPAESLPGRALHDEPRSRLGGYGLLSWRAVEPCEHKAA